MMQITIQEQHPQPLLGRTQITADVVFEGKTPTRALVRAALARTVKAEEELVIVRAIENAYGSPRARVTAYVYAKAQERDRIEQKHILKRSQSAKPAQEGAASATPAANEGATEQSPDNEKKPAADEAVQEGS